MKKLGNIYFHGDRKSKNIALTFDDGPCEETKQILKILKKENVKATFFIWGEKIKGNEEIIKQEIKQGCEVGNHSLNHFRLWFKSEKTIEEQIKKTDQELERIGIKTNLFRPPCVSFDLTLLKVTKSFNKKIILFDFITDDWKQPGTNKIINHVLKKLKNGSIIGLHDYIQGIGRNKQIIQALKIIIPELKKREYKFVTVSELLDF